MTQNNSIYISALSLFLLLLLTRSCFAGDTLSHRFPQFILIQLSSQRNRIEAMQRERKYSAIAEVNSDAEGVKAATIQDFTDHFHYCPVYYYVDTNMDLVKKGDFENILFNGDGSPVNNPAVNGHAKNYLVAYYGYPVTQARKTESKDDSVEKEYNSGEPMGKGLVVDNSKFQQVAYFYRFGYEDALFSKKGEDKYTYHSKHYDIEYNPFAAKLEKKLVQQRR